MRFKVALPCIHCASLNDAGSIRLYTSGLGQDPLDTYASPGDLLDLDVMDFEDAYVTVRRPLPSDDVMTALETWGCRVCGHVQIARLRFSKVSDGKWRFLDASAVSLTRRIFDETHFVSRKLEEYTAQPDDDVERIRGLYRAYKV